MVSVDPTTDRISTGGFAYDANGNMTQWPLGGNTIARSCAVFVPNGELLDSYRKCAIGSGYYVPCNRRERVCFFGRCLQKDGNLVVVDRLGTVGTAAGYPCGEASGEPSLERPGGAPDVPSQLSCTNRPVCRH